MCGIFALLNNNMTISDEIVKKAFNNLKHRNNYDLNFRPNPRLTIN